MIQSGAVKALEPVLIGVRSVSLAIVAFLNSNGLFHLAVEMERLFKDASVVEL